MTSTLSIASQKGGVGKTTVALNLGYALGVRGWRTLIIDVDPQGSLGQALSRKVSAAPGLADHIVDKIPLQDTIIRTRVAGMGVLPVGRVSIDRLFAFEDAIQNGVLYQIIEKCQPDYDVIILDTASGFGPTTVGAMCASTHLLTPVQAEPIALRSLPRILEWVGWLHDKGSEIELVGILLTMLNADDPISAKISQELWSRFPQNLILSPPVPRDGTFLKANAAGVPVALLKRRPPPLTRVFDSLAGLVEEKLNLYTDDEDDEPIPFVD